MPNKKISSEDIVAAAQELFDTAARARIELLNRFSQIQGERAARLETMAASLQVQKGAKDPAVLELKHRSTSTRAFEAGLKETAAREARTPRLKEGEWLVFGRVFDRTGRPLSSLRVRVLDRDRKYKELLRETTTDEHGEFKIVYHEQGFKEVGEMRPDLHVTVSDSADRTLYSSRDALRFEAGNAEYFEIQISEQRRAATGKGHPTAKKRTHKK